MCPTDPDRLTSWKEIAEFLDCDVRTAQRWKDERGMPVHRVPGGKKSSVYAYRGEIDGWLRGAGAAERAVPKAPAERISAPSQPGTEIDVSGSATFSRYRAPHVRLIVPLTLVLAMIAMGFYLQAPARQVLPVRARVTLDSVQAFDGDGRELWRHRFPEPLDDQLEYSRNSLDEYVRIVDLHNDGTRQVLIVTPRRVGHNDDGVQYQLDCFSEQGRLLWSYVPTGDFQFGAHELDGPWHILDVFVSQDRPPRIWVAATHSMWGNSFVAEVDPQTGRGTIRFVNTGIIYRINTLRAAHGSYLLAAGWNNEHDGGSLAAIDLRKAYAVSPQTAGTRHKCMNCKTGDPDQYIVLPRSELNKYLRSYEDSVAGLHISGDSVVIQKFATRDSTPPGRPHVIYSFTMTSALGFKSVRYDSQYDMLHQRLFDERKLDHSIENCRERRHPLPIRVWTPARGWKDQPVPSSGAAE